MEIIGHIRDAPVSSVCTYINLHASSEFSQISFHLSKVIETMDVYIDASKDSDVILSTCDWSRST